MLIQVTLTIGGRITVWLVSSLTRFGCEKEWKYLGISMKWSRLRPNLFNWRPAVQTVILPPTVSVLRFILQSFFSKIRFYFVQTRERERERERTSFLIRNCFSPFLSSSQSEASIEIRIFGAWMKQIFQNRQKGLKGHKAWGGSLAFSICHTRFLFHSHCSLHTILKNKTEDFRIAGVYLRKPLRRLGTAASFRQSWNTEVPQGKN